MTASGVPGVIGRLHALAAFHAAVADVAAPDTSTSASGVARAVPCAAFQCACGTTPAVSVAASDAPVLPTKSIPTPTATGPVPEGTICTALTGARTTAVDELPGVA